MRKGIISDEDLEVLNIWQELPEIRMKRDQSPPQYISSMQKVSRRIITDLEESISLDEPSNFRIWEQSRALESIIYEDRATFSEQLANEISSCLEEILLSRKIEWHTNRWVNCFKVYVTLGIHSSKKDDIANMAVDIQKADADGIYSIIQKEYFGDLDQPLSLSLPPFDKGELTNILEDMSVNIHILERSKRIDRFLANENIVFPIRKNW